MAIWHVNSHKHTSVMSALAASKTEKTDDTIITLYPN